MPPHLNLLSKLVIISCIRWFSKAVAIPYEDTSLPGYLCINPTISGLAPTIIFQEGKGEGGCSMIRSRLAIFFVVASRA